MRCPPPPPGVLGFPKQLARTYPRRRRHLVCDNYATHKHPTVRAWLARHPRIQLHFTPTWASWVNLVEVLLAVGVVTLGIGRSRHDLGRDTASFHELAIGVGGAVLRVSPAIRLEVSVGIDVVTQGLPVRSGHVVGHPGMSGL